MIIENPEFLARLEAEDIQQCPACLFYYSATALKKHALTKHNHGCRVPDCKATFDSISNEMVHSARKV